MKNSNFKFEIHFPVLLNEVLEYLNPKPNENFVDCTFGGGGHALAILEKTKPNGKVLGIEIDPELYKIAKEKIKHERLILVRDSFLNLKKIIERENFRPIAGIFFDLGISSWHLEKSKRGFSFLRKEPLIMRYDADLTKLTAAEVVNNWTKEEIEKILREFGQEKFAKKIAKAICKEREKKKIETTTELVKIIEKAVPSFYKKRKIHFATKTFLALRIVVNEELENLKKGLKEAMEMLDKKGKLVVISFHSLEDKIVKNFFKEQEREGKLRILTKKPISPKKEEILKNPRSRSAKLRAAVKI